MRRPRVKVEGEGFYHVVSRIGGKRFLIDEAEKGVLLGMIRGAAAFSGVELYTYAVMSNHFHLVVRVPRRREVSEAELLRRMRALYGPAKFAKVLDKWDKWAKRGMESRVEDEKARMRARMYDLSQFCKTFKEAYTQDYNKRHENTGTIWEGRFKSILLEGSHRALMTVSGYVHLNPVRAKVVERPECSKWTGYGAGCKGDAEARSGLQALVERAYNGGKPPSWSRAQEICALVIDGACPSDVPIDDIARDGVSSGEVTPQNKPERERPTLSVYELLRRRVAGFLHGGALGGASFLRGAAALLPPRVRRRGRVLLDEVPRLGLTSIAGVRNVS